MITKIYVVYAAVPFIVLERDGVITSNGNSVDEIDFNELGNYVSLFKQQQDVLGNGYNWSRGYYTKNNKQYEAAIFNAIDGGSTPPPGAANKNFICANLSNVGAITVNGFVGLAFDIVSGEGYNAALPVFLSEAIRGDIETPTSGGAFVSLSVAGVPAPDVLHILSFGETFKYTQMPIADGLGQLMPFDYDVSYGGSLTVIIIVGTLIITPPAPPAAEGNFRLDTNKPNYAINSVDAADIAATGFTFPVSNAIQNGTWSNNLTNNITINVTAAKPPAGNAFATAYIDGVAVDTQVIPNGTNNVTFVNIPNPMNNADTLRITVYGD